MILLYDGSFEGFLSLVYEVYYKKLQPNRIYKELPQELILEELIEIETSKENSAKVLTAIKEKFPKILDHCHRSIGINWLMNNIFC